MLHAVKSDPTFPDKADEFQRGGLRVTGKCDPVWVAHRVARIAWIVSPSTESLLLALHWTLCIGGVVSFPLHPLMGLNLILGLRTKQRTRSDVASL